MLNWFSEGPDRPHTPVGQALALAAGWYDVSVDVEWLTVTPPTVKTVISTWHALQDANIHKTPRVPLPINAVFHSDTEVAALEFVHAADCVVDQHT